MSTFDASTHYNPAPEDVPSPDVRHTPYRDPDPEPVGVSTLDELRFAAEETDDREPITVTNPLDTIRLTLRTDIEQKDIQAWQHKALPQKHRDQLRRRGGNPNLSLLDPVVMFAHAIAATTTQVEVRSRATGEWRPVIDQNTGDPLTFADAGLRQVIGGLDTVSAVKRAFNRSEPSMLEAGQRLLDASGFGLDDDSDGLGDDGDPTNAAG